MNPVIIFIAIALLIIFGALFLHQQGRGEPVFTEVMEGPAPTGVFTLILHGGGHGSDLTTVAFLDGEGDNISFDPFRPDFEYKKIPSLQAGEALNRAEAFIKSHHAYSGSVLKRIVNSRGFTLGYEMRPLYQAVSVGATDVIDIHYVLKGGKVVISITLKPEIERFLRS